MTKPSAAAGTPFRFGWRTRHRIVKYRFADKDGQPADTSFQEGEPLLEGLQLHGRYCVIYSKYDLSCALERQSSVSCAGYEYHDAIRIAVNVIRYALLQDFSYAGKIT